MEFFCFHRDRPDTDALWDELVEAHWSYMDRFELIARGPTATGSVHILRAPDATAARAFVFDEPIYQAGGYRDVLLRRWRNTLGHTMWDSPGDREGYLVLGLGAGEPADLAVPQGDLIAYGPLSSDDETHWLGTAALVRAHSPDQARAVLTADRYATIEVESWEFGGRR